MADQNKMQVLFGADGRPLTKTLGELETELKGFQQALKTTTDPTAIDQLNRSLASTQKNISLLKNFTIGPNEGNLRRSLGTVNSFNQLLREMPAFAFSAQTGILALSNNIPIFMDRITEARAGGAKFGTIFKDIGRSLLSFPSLLTIGVSALTIFGDRIFSTGKKATQAQDEFEAFLKSVRSAGQIRGDAAGSVAGQIAEVNALTKAVLDQTRSETERGRALTRLKQINKEYYGAFDLATVSTKQLTAATNDFTNALIANAVVAGFEDEIKKVAPELAKQRRELEQLSDQYERFKKARERQKGDVIDEFGANLSAARREAAIGDPRAAIDAQREKIEQLSLQYRDLQFDIKGAVDESLKFKPLSSSGGGGKADSEKAGLTLQQMFRIIRNKQSEEFLKLSEESEKGAAAYYDRLIKAMTAGQDRLRQVIAGGPKGQFSLYTQADPTGGSTSETTQLEENYKILQKIRDLGGTPVPTDYLSDIGARNLILKEQLATLTKLNEKQIEMAQSMNTYLQPAFSTFFQTVLDGSQSMGQAFGDMLKNLIKQLITTIATAAALAAIMTLIFPGAGGFGTFFKAFMGIGKMPQMGGGGGGSGAPGMANPGFNGGGMGMAPLQVVGEIRGAGRDLVLVINNELKSQGRTF